MKITRTLGGIGVAVWLALSALIPSAAEATTQYPTGTAGESVGAVMFGCLNGSNQWVPATTSGTCLGSGSGGGGSSFGSAFPSSGTAIGFTDGTNMVAGKVRTPGSSALTSDPAIVVTDPDAIAAINSATPAGTNLIGNIGQIYPAGSTPITASATGTTAATTATLAANASLHTYICGYSIRANATAAATVTNTITGVVTGTLSSLMWVAPLASGIGVDEQIFSPCIISSAVNTNIAVVSGIPGSGGNVTVKAWGFQL